MSAWPLRCPSLPAIKAVTGFELPARCAAYVADFMAASENAKAVCEGTPAGFIASKMPNQAP
jgi:hypothetical protein